MIQIKQVDKYFGKFKALDHINLHIKKGSVYGLVGPNGAGKTTLIKHIVGVFQQDKGNVLVDGEKVYENKKLKERMVFIPDELYFFSQYTIKAMAEFYKKTYPKWNQERYNKLKTVFNMEDNRKISRLSKGMKKQVAFWIAICCMPDVMILDEPVDGLDPVMRKKVWSLLVQDVAERQMTVLVSSHNLRELEDICDYVGIMHQGKVLIQRDLDDLKSDIHKIQVAFKDEYPTTLFDNEVILHKENKGSVYVIIIKGNEKELIEKINKYNPLVLDILPLTLEEIFMYEVGGVGYEFKDIIL